MRHFLIITNSIKDKGLVVTGEIKSYILKKGGTVVNMQDDTDCEADGSLKEAVLKDVDCVIVLGGDGTFLRAANSLSPLSVPIPIIGVNLGTLGFLTEVEPSNIHQMIDRLMEENYQIEDRMQLKGCIYRDGELLYKGNALNDIVVSRAGFSRIIGLKIYVNDTLLDIYEADGVIISTPTGSTGYNLSAGGPIVSPKTSLIIVTPISPHSLTSKSIAFSSEDEIMIEVVHRLDNQNEEAYANFDGKSGMQMMSGDKIVIQKAKEVTKLIKIYNKGFYEILRNKIGK